MIQYSKYSEVSIKAGKRELGTKTILEFFKCSNKRTKYERTIVMNSLEILPDHSIAFLETKKKTDNFYQKDNYLLSEMVEKLNPIFKHYQKEKLSNI